MRGRIVNESAGYEGDRCFDNNNLKEAINLYLKQLQICFTQKHFETALKYSKKIIMTLLRSRMKGIIKNDEYYNISKNLKLIKNVWNMTKNIEQKALVSYEISMIFYTCGEHLTALSILQYALNKATSHQLNAFLHAADIYCGLNVGFHHGINSIERSKAISMLQTATNMAKNVEQKALISYKSAQIYYRLGESEWALKTLKYALENKSLCHFDACILGCEIYNILQMDQAGINLYKQTKKLYPQKMKTAPLCVSISVNFGYYGEKNCVESIKFMAENIDKEDHAGVEFYQRRNDKVEEIKQTIFQHDLTKW